MVHLWERETVGAAIYLKGCDDAQVEEAVQGMRSLEGRMLETPISKGRAVLSGYGKCLFYINIIEIWN